MRKVVAFILALSIFTSALAQEQKPDPIKIGVFLSLTGSTSAYGISANNSFKLAAEEVNKSGGINGRQVELITEDDHSNTNEVARIVEKLIKQDKVHALLAETISTRAMAAAPVAQANKVVMISPAAVKPELTMTGDYIFRACFISSTEGEAVAKFAIKKLKAKRAAVIWDNKNDYAVVLGKFFIEHFRKLGGQLVSQQTYEVYDKDISAQIRSINPSNPDLIFAPGFFNTAALVAREVKRQQSKAILIGSDGWDSPSLLEGVGDIFDGVYFPNHFWVGRDDAVTKKFVADYTTKYGSEPDAGAAATYDAAHLLFDAIRRAKSTESSAIRDALAKTVNFPGATGRITINAQRNANVPVYMLRIEKGGKFTLQEEIL